MYGVIPLFLGMVALFWGWPKIRRDEGTTATAVAVIGGTLAFAYGLVKFLPWLAR